MMLYIIFHLIRIRIVYIGIITNTYRVAEWRASLLDKGLNVNAGTFKVMVGSSGVKMIVNSGKWPCGVCGKGVQANSVQCTICNTGIHKRCSGVRGDLSREADGFKCRRCDGTIQEVDLAEDVMVGRIPVRWGIPSFGVRRNGCWTLPPFFGGGVRPTT